MPVNVYLSMRSLIRLVAVSLFLIGLFACPCARAEMLLKVDWGRAVTDASSWLRSQGHSKDRSSPIGSLRRGIDEDVSVLGTDPRMALILRDWEGGHRLAGGYMSVTDAIRMSRSTRMLVGRIALTSGLVMPFIQLGAGQWRVDKDMQPFLPKDSELAALAGGGFEIGIARKLAFALETDFTLLYRETREATNIDTAHIFSAFAAVRLEL